MDATTIAAYDAGARAYCEEWLTQPPADDLQALWRAHLRPGASTIDVGSGSGRDADWLTRHGYPCVGVDASAGLVAEATRRFPGCRFGVARLPALEGFGEGAFVNVVCETVIMHLPADDVVPAVEALGRLLAPGGVLFLSWRVVDADARDAAGRLYTAICADAVRRALSPLALAYDREETSLSSGRRVHRIVVRRPAS
jgi:SAM-dependent methyltransferase